MTDITRRHFSGLALVLAASPRHILGATGLNEALRSAVEKRKIPAATAMVATADKTIYTGAFGKRDASSGVAVTPDSIFSIASMTKAITSTAAMQLVEQGKLQLDEPASKRAQLDRAGPDLQPFKVVVTLDRCR